MESIISRHNCQELTYDGQKWAPTPTFLSGLSWLKATQKWKSLEDQIMSTEASPNVSPALPPATLEDGTSASSDVIPAPTSVPAVVMPAPPDPRYPYDWKKYDKTPWEPNSSSRFSDHSMSALCPETTAGLTKKNSAPPCVLPKSLLAPSAPPAPPTDHLNAPCSVLKGGPLERCIDLSTWGGEGGGG